MTRTLEICTLGGLTIAYDKQPVVELGSHKAEALLVYLARTRRSYPRQVLAEFFWPDRPQTQSLANLRRELMALRQQIDACINTTRDAVEMDSSAACWLDVAEFERNLATVDQSSTPAGTLAGDSVSQLERALALYRGDFLDGFYVDSPAFEDWARLERERLRFQALNILDTLVTHAMAEHDSSAGIAYATRLMQMDSLREMTHRQLMLLLAQSGQREAALAQYETCHRLLADELGVEPTAETTTLYEQIRSGTAMSDSSNAHRLKGYELRERIGAGGFGEVYRAYQPAVGREVAIKVILPQYANEPDFIRRFEAEAQLIARLENPFIVPLYDYWREPGGAYLVMRCLHESLRDRLQRGPLALDEAARLVDQIASALAAAHRQHVIHRDLKPANILLDDEGNSYLADFGIAKGPLVSLEATQAGRVVGSPAYLSPEQIRSEPVTPGADIYSFGVMLYEMLTGQHPFPPDLTPTALLYKHLSEPIPSLRTVRSDLPVALDEVIQRATAKDFARRYPDTFSLAAAFRQAAMPEHWTAPGESTTLGMPGVSLEAGETTWTPAAPRNPYKGLRAFEQADAVDFFGRQVLTDQLLARLAEEDAYSRFLAVVGPSGCGKSSVVKAGVVPALRAGKLPGSDQWFIAEMLPGSHPLEELELALIRIAATPGLNLLPLLREDERGLLRAVRQLLPDKATLLLVIDQFEEVFTLVQDAAERAFFLDCLLAAMTDPRSPLRVVITLRADFTDRPLLHPAFGDLLRRRIEFVLPMTADELNQAITAPAEHVDVHLMPEFLTALVKDVHDEPGILPLLQYAMTEVFEMRDGQSLTLAGYQAVGGVLGALAQRADEMYIRLDRPQQAIAKQIFLRLVTLGEGIEDTRRRTRQSELRAVASSASALNSGPGMLQTVLDAFGKARLLTFDRDPLTREPTVEVAHEALIREWQRLRAWLDESRSDIRQQRLLAAAASEWRMADQDTSYLLTGSRLAQFEDWSATTTLVLTQEEHVYLNTSISERQQEENAERERQTKELHTQRQLAEQRQRAANRLRYLVMAMTLFLLVAVGLSIFAFDREGQAQDARTKAEREAAVNHSLVLASSARDIRTSGNSDLALQLALAAVDIENPPIEAQNTLRTIASQPGTRAVLIGHSQRVRTVAFSPDGKLGLSGSCAVLTADNVCTRGELILWDLQRYTEIRRFGVHTGWVTSVAFSPDGQTALSASEDHTIILWNVSAGQLIRRLEGHTDSVNSVAFSPDGKTAISASSDKTLVLWNVDTGEIVRRYQGHTGGVNRVIIARDGKTAISGSDDTTAIRWNIATGDILMRYAKHAGGIVDVAVSPDGRTFLSAGMEGDYRLWDVDSGAAINRGGIPTPPIGLAFTPDGNSFTFIQGTVLNVTSIAKWFVADILAGHSAPLLSADVSADGKFALTGSADRTVRLWNLKSQENYRRFETFDELQTGLLVFSPDHRSLVSGTEVGQVLMWDIATGKIVRRFDEDQKIPILGIAFTPDGKYMAVSAGAFQGDPKAGGLTLWDFETGQIVRRFEGQGGWILGIAFSPDGRTLLSGSSHGNTGTGELVLWDVATGAIVRRFEDTEDIAYLTLSSDGRQAITGSWSRYHAILWDTTTGKEIRRFDGVHTDATNFAVFVPGEKAVVTSGYDSLLQVWDNTTGQKLRRFNDTAPAFGPSFSSDGRYMANGNGYGTATLWDFQTGDILQRIDTYAMFPDLRGNYVWSTIFNPNGKSVFFVIGDNVLHKIVPVEWLINTQSMDDLRAWIKANRYIRDLTCDEQAQYKIEPLCKAGKQY